MISHAIVPREFLSRNVLAGLFGVENQFGRIVLRHQKHNHDGGDNDEKGNVEPPRAVEVLDGLGLQEIVAYSEERALVHEISHILYTLNKQ